MALDSVKNAFVQKLLERILDGDKGSNILGAVLTVLVAAHLNWMQVLAGFKFDNVTDTTEAAKATGMVAMAVFAYFVGRKKPTV